MDRVFSSFLRQEVFVWTYEFLVPCYLKLGETCEHGIHLYFSVPFCCMLIIILFKKGERGGSSSLVQMLSLEREDHLQGGLAPFCGMLGKLSYLGPIYLDIDCFRWINRASTPDFMIPMAIYSRWTMTSQPQLKLI